jgi:hypothetical protein
MQSICYRLSSFYISGIVLLAASIFASSFSLAAAATIPDFLLLGIFLYVLLNQERNSFIHNIRAWH